MTTSKRFVLDTNVIVSALLNKRSVPRQALDHARKTGQLLLSPQLHAELDRILRKPKFDRYLDLEDRLQFFAALAKDAIVITTTSTIKVCRDPKDNMILELAVDGQADMIVSGDKDLTALHPFREIPILIPQVFLETDLS